MQPQRPRRLPGLGSPSPDGAAAYMPDEQRRKLFAKYGDLSKKVHLRGLSSDCYQLLERLNGEKPDYELMEPGPEDPIYEVAEDYSKYGTISVPRKDAAPPAADASEE